MQNTIDLSGLLTPVATAPGVRDWLAAARSGSHTLGIPDAAKPATIAALANSVDAPLLVVVNKETHAVALAEEIAAWLGDPGRVVVFPERDALPFERLAPPAEVVRDRLRCITALASGARLVIVASALAVIQRTVVAQDARGATVLRTGGSLDPEEFMRTLLRLGYSIAPLVEESGQASRRGGIVDVFPPAAERPVRIEFLGREIDSLRTFDHETQRSTGAISEAEISPALEVLAPDLSRLASLDFSRTSPEIRTRFEEELEELRAGLAPRDAHYYVPFLTTDTILGHLPEGSVLVVDEEPDVEAAVDDAGRLAESARGELEARGEIPTGLPDPLASWRELREAINATANVVRLSRWAIDEASDVPRLPFSTAPIYGGQVRKLVHDVASAASERTIVIVSLQAQRLSELLSEEGVMAPVVTAIPEHPRGAVLVHGALAEGWQLDDGDAPLEVLTDSEIFGFSKQRRPAPRRTINRDAFLAELSQGGYVVHIDHGIARFAGLIRRTVDGIEREYLELHYAEGDKLYVPTDQLERVSRYIGPSDRQPRITRLGSGEWQRAKQRVRKAVQSLARDLLQLYATREVLPGFAYPADSAWQLELEASFPFVETPDQAEAISAVKRDMEQPRPMDRIVCGDVGYGKTEVAIRAAFKAVNAGRQVAVLVPTTVLAQQHFNTFTERLAAFPVRVEVLSRFRSDSEQKAVVADLAAGSVDIIIGTHRLLQKDVAFKDLGLIVIDEEQRFGVNHKEYLKKVRREVDVLTLSATPIPRTLYMAMGSLRDMSTIETPPEERLPIKTYVSEFDEQMVHEAIGRELERGGQVYFVHNRVHNIGMIAGKAADIAPDARIGIGHGQMDEKELARTMDDFVHGRTDVLVCTTIIESGLDIPNVNTIIINQADRLGLGQLYQLRGRVGRSAHRAYAYLLYDRRAHLTETAKQRLQTIFEATELGAGFQIALRDLEIRGAGNLLGSEQSGFMATVGFDLYVKLLSGAVERLRSILRGEIPKPDDDAPDVSLDLPISAHLPPSYVPDINQRLALYQRFSGAEDEEEIGAIAQEMVDRFGDPPELARNLLYVVSLRALARSSGVANVVREGDQLILRMREGEVLNRDALEDLVPKGVQVGRSVARIELGDRWRERLRKTLDFISALRVTIEPPTAEPVVAAGQD